MAVFNSNILHGSTLLLLTTKFNFWNNSDILTQGGLKYWAPRHTLDVNPNGHVSYGRLSKKRRKLDVKKTRELWENGLFNYTLFLMFSIPKHSTHINKQQCSVKHNNHIVCYLLTLVDMFRFPWNHHRALSEKIHIHYTELDLPLPCLKSLKCSWKRTLKNHPVCPITCFNSSMKCICIFFREGLMMIPRESKHVAQRQ